MKTGIVTKDGVTVAIKTPNSFKKICKLFFTSKDTSLYVHFYSKSEIYYYGLAHFPAGVAKLDIKFTNGRKVNRAPKLSYHESGQVHFKLGEHSESLEMVRATPLGQLNDRHIITIHLFGLEVFEQCDAKKEKTYCVIQLQEELSNHKLTIYGSRQDITTRYPVGFVLGRDQDRVFFGLLHSNPEQTFANQKGFYAISGWDHRADTVENAACLLFLFSEF
jgi:hypothetical protein